MSCDYIAQTFSCLQARKSSPLLTSDCSDVIKQETHLRIYVKELLIMSLQLKSELTMASNKAAIAHFRIFYL